MYIALNHVYKSFGDIHVLTDVNFNFDFKRTYAITGASGAGKSTLMHILAGTQQPDSGTVDWCGELKVNQLSAAQKAPFWNHNLGLIFQQANLINELTVLENVALKGLIGAITQPFAKAKELLKRVGLAPRENYFPFTLSRGEQQRVAIVRALMCHPRLILADEPTASLDRHNGKQILDLLTNLAREYQIGLIVSAHDHYVCDRLEQVVALTDCKLNLKR